MDGQDDFDDELLENVANSLGQAWPTVSTYLGFDDGACQAIIASHPDQLSQQARQMLMAWRADYTGTDLMGDLKGALRAGGLFTLLQDLGEEILDTSSLKNVARGISESWPKLAVHLSFGVEECETIRAAFQTPREQAGQMLANWRHHFGGDSPVEYLARALIAIGFNNLARELAPQKTLPKCSCANDKTLKYRPYFSKGDDGNTRVIGICCTKCGQEWLEERFLFHPDTDNTRPSFKVRGALLKKQLKVPTENNPAFMVKASRTEIGTRFYCLKVGDHITWRRCRGYWHHAIISEIGLREIKVKAFHWRKSDCGVVQITENWLDLSEEQGELFRIDYPAKITKANPPELVIARAGSRLGDTGYELLSDNCEAFASYCKSGHAESHQVVWLYQKIRAVMKEALIHIAGSVSEFAIEEFVEEGAKVFLGEGVEAAGNVVVHTIKDLVQGTGAIGAGIILVFEGLACVFDLKKIYKKREKAGISRRDFVASVLGRVTEAVVSAGLGVGGRVAGAVVGGVVGTLINPGFGTVLGAFIGGVVGGVVGSVFGQCLGSFVGSPIGRALAKTIGTDDRAVLKTDDLNPGDQVVFYGNLLHPRHHAIVVECDKGKVQVVHNTYQNGVVEESVEFRPPVYRLVYDENDCYPPDEVIKRARSKIGDETYKYSLAFNNCKSFSRWCKVK